MRKMWRVILSIVLILILIGIIAVAVGFLTGADSARIYQTAENNNLINLTENGFRTVDRNGLLIHLDTVDCLSFRNITGNFNRNRNGLVR